jgi:GNAT superfamily N-acetyltransferase
MADPSPTIVIRDATEPDAPAIAGLLGELGYPAGAESIPGRIGRMRAEPGQHLLVAESDGQVVGMATVVVRHVINNDAPFGRLASIVVADGWRSRGIGQRLVEHAEEIARQTGCNLIEVTSADHRPRAHDFYRRLGYTERPRRFIKQL